MRACAAAASSSLPALLARAQEIELRALKRVQLPAHIDRQALAHHGTREARAADALAKSPHMPWVLNAAGTQAWLTTASHDVHATTYMFNLSSPFFGTSLGAILNDTRRVSELTSVMRAPPEAFRIKIPAGVAPSIAHETITESLQRTFQGAALIKLALLAGDNALRAELARGALHALQAFQMAGVVHRDFKADNLLVMVGTTLSNDAMIEATRFYLQMMRAQSGHAARPSVAPACIALHRAIMIRACDFGSCAAPAGQQAPAPAATEQQHLVQRILEAAASSLHKPAPEAHVAMDHHSTPYICSRHARAPELFLGCTRYTSSADMYAWAVLVTEIWCGAPLLLGRSDAAHLLAMMLWMGAPSAADLAALRTHGLTAAAADRVTAACAALPLALHAGPDPAARVSVLTSKGMPHDIAQAVVAIMRWDATLRPTIAAVRAACPSLVPGIVAPFPVR